MLIEIYRGRRGTDVLRKTCNIWCKADSRADYERMDAVVSMYLLQSGAHNINMCTSEPIVAKWDACS